MVSNRVGVDPEAACLCSDGQLPVVGEEYELRIDIVGPNQCCREVDRIESANAGWERSHGPVEHDAIDRQDFHCGQIDLGLLLRLQQRFRRQWLQQMAVGNGAFDLDDNQLARNGGFKLKVRERSGLSESSPDDRDP